MKRSKITGLVYSTETGRTCPGCGHPKKQCCCSQKSSVPQGDGIVRVSRETKGRKGSGVTVISGIPLAGAALRDLAGQLKKKCSSGGTVKNGTIVIQGDHRQVVAQILQDIGFRSKISGG